MHPACFIFNFFYTNFNFNLINKYEYAKLMNTFRDGCYGCSPVQIPVQMTQSTRSVTQTNPHLTHFVQVWVQPEQIHDHPW